MTTALRIAQGSFGRVALLDMNKPLVAHAHSQCHVVMKAGGADSWFFVRERAQAVTDRTAILVNAWEPHHYDHDPAAPSTIYLALYIEPAWLAGIHPTLQLTAHPDFFPQPCVQISPRIRALADSLIAELLSVGQIPQARLETLLFDLMIAIIESFSDWRNVNGIVVPNGPDARVQRAISYMKANLSQPLDVDRLAAEAHLSRAQFFVRFRRFTRMTPGIFFNMMRIEAACQRLAQPDERATLGVLCRELGFADQAHFTRFVRGHVGVTPSEYRRVVELYAPVVRALPAAPQSPAGRRLS